MHAERIADLLANPFHRVLRAHQRLTAIYPDDTRRCRLLARGFSLLAEKPLSWQNVAAMLDAEQKVSK